MDVGTSGGKITAMIKGIIFDLFGVISSEVAPFWFWKHFSEEKYNKLKNEYTKPLDLGLISQSEYFAKLAGISKTSPNIVRDKFFSYVEINNDVIDLIKELKKKFKIALCSNASGSFVREILKKHRLEDLFDVTVISSDLGATKPDKKVYQETLDRLGLLPTEVILIEDNPKNIEGGEAVGIKGILFKSADKLRESLFSEIKNS